MMHIKDLIPGDKARIVDFGATDWSYKNRLLSLGLTRGIEFSVVRTAPLGCPIHIEVRGTSLILRKNESSQLILERL
jgi:ferrous iron transport protein A